MDGTRVQRLRRERGFTQERLAEASGITVRTVQRIEAGNSATLETQALIARTLGVELDDLRTPEEAAAAETAPVEAAAARASVAEAPPTRPARTPDPAPVRRDADDAARQQERRDAMRDGARSLYAGVGVILTLGVVFAIAAGVLPDLAIVIVPAYWAGGLMLANAAYLFLLGPHLDRAYPLSRDRDPHRGRDRIR
jgi:transcriptional regulator with XRE-family HTH domain